MCSTTARCVVGLGATIQCPLFCQILKISQQKSCKIFQYLPKSCQMSAEERQKRIENYLKKVEFASLEELAKQVDASTSTVRRDLTLMETTGVLKRTHGGARMTEPSSSDEFIFSPRETHQLAEKEAIGKACAELIQPNQSVIIDAGSTTYQVARHLENKTPHIITNSLPVANLFAGANRLEVVFSRGGIYSRL